MFGLEKIADSFDHMHAEVQRDWDRLMLQDPGRWAGKTFGPDSLINYYFAIPAGVTWAIGTFTMAQGKALVDVLRLGEGVKSGTAGGFAEDGLRVLQLIPLASAGGKLLGPVARMTRLAGLSRVAGLQGAMSCGPTAVASAARVSGQSVAMTLQDVGAAFGKGNPQLANFPGMHLGELRTTMNALSLTTQDLQFAGQGIEDVAAVAKQGRGPVVIGVQWWNRVGGILRPVNNARFDAAAPEHWLVAFRNSTGKVMVADQFGIRPIADLGKINNVVSEYTLASEGFLVPDAAVASGGFSKVTGLAAQTVQTNRNWFSVAFAFQMVTVNTPRFWTLDATVRQAQGLSPRPWPGMPPDVLDRLRASAGTNGNGQSGGGEGKREIPAPATIPIPNLLSSALQADAQLVLSKMPKNADTREYAQLRVETGLSDSRLRDALLSLMRSGLLQATYWFQQGGGATPGVVRRTVVQ